MFTPATPPVPVFTPGNDTQRALTLVPKRVRRVNSHAGLNDPTPEKLRALQHETGYPMISILASTAPDLEIDSAVIRRVNALLRLAETRLASEMDPKEAADRIAPLEQFAGSLIGQRSGHGLAIFGSSKSLTAFRVASHIEDRVVIDPTFATRDLARSLALNPRYRLLVLGRDMARVFIGSARRLQEVSDAGFPMQRFELLDRGNRSIEVERLRKGRHADTVFVRRVAAGLGSFPESADLPLIAVVSTSMGNALRDTAAINPVGTVTGSYERSPRGRLIEIARPSIDAHLAAVRETALGRLAHARGIRRSATGINHVWTAAQQNSIETLLIDETYRYPAWTTLGGRRLVRAFTIENPEVIDDAVDEIIEMVQHMDGQVCFVSAGELGTDGIAAVLTKRVS